MKKKKGANSERQEEMIRLWRNIPGKKERKYKQAQMKEEGRKNEKEKIVMTHYFIEENQQKKRREEK